MYKPDQTDWKIIELLIKDGRMSSAEISRKLDGVSARTVNNRIDLLTKEGIINIRSIVTPELVGYGVLADVSIEVEPGKLRDVADRLSDLPLVSYLALTTGDTDISASVRVQNIDELFNFVIEVIEVIGKIPGVRQTKTYPLPFNLKDNNTWMPPDALIDSEQEK